MDAKNRALCFMYRNPPAGQALLSYPKIAEKVFNKEGGHPTAASVRECVTTWNEEKKKRGRTEGMYMRCNGAVSKVNHDPSSFSSQRTLYAGAPSTVYGLWASFRFVALGFFGPFVCSFESRCWLLDLVFQVGVCGPGFSERVLRS